MIPQNSQKSIHSPILLQTNSILSVNDLSDVTWYQITLKESNTSLSDSNDIGRLWLTKSLLFQKLEVPLIHKMEFEIINRMYQFNNSSSHKYLQTSIVNYLSLIIWVNTLMVYIFLLIFQKSWGSPILRILKIGTS